MKHRSGVQEDFSPSDVQEPGAAETLLRCFHQVSASPPSKLRCCCQCQQDFNEFTGVCEPPVIASLLKAIVNQAVSYKKKTVAVFLLFIFLRER